MTIVESSQTAMRWSVKPSLMGKIHCNSAGAKVGRV
jgi:hypothetical protein